MRGSQYNARIEEVGAAAYCIYVVLLKDIHTCINHTQTDKSKEYEAAIQELH